MGTFDDKRLRILASIGLAVGGVFGMIGALVPHAGLQSVAWGIDGIGLVMASALLTLKYYRDGSDVVAAGFLVFAMAEAVVLSGAPASLEASVPSFGAGCAMWALALALISVGTEFPRFVRILGLAAGVMFAATAFEIFAGVELLPTSSPLPFFSYPLFVMTFAGWIWTLLRQPGPDAV